MNGTRMTDQELTDAYRAYGNMVYRIALVQTKNKAHAEDIQQNVFLALVRYSDRIRSEAHLKAWLIRVTQNACKKHFRSLLIRLTVLYDDTLYKEQEMDSGGMAAASGSAGNDPAEEDNTEVVRDAVEQLPPKSRAVIHLFYYEEMSIREIAVSLGMTESNVKTRLSRARDQLRQIIGVNTT